MLTLIKDVLKISSDAENESRSLTFFGWYPGNTSAMMYLLKNAIGAGPPWVVLYVLTPK